MTLRYVGRFFLLGRLLRALRLARFQQVLKVGLEGGERVGVGIALGLLG
jgi:hypothetical protein